MGHIKNTTMKDLKLKFYSPAEDSIEGWEKYSFPIGNGYAGASVFGGVKKERLQITTNVFANTFDNGGVSDFVEIYINSGVKEFKNYKRELDIVNGIASSCFNYKNTSVKRVAFYNYPENALVYKITSDKEIEFSVQLVIPFLGARSTEQGGRTGSVSAENDCLVMRGSLPSRELLFEGRLTVLTDGDTKYDGNTVSVEKSRESVILFVFDTSYLLCEETFKKGVHKALGEDPHDKAVNLLRNAVKIGYDGLYENHINDFSEIMKRVEFDLNGEQDERSTEELLQSDRKGNFEPYLEELYYQYGRYLLLSSSRKGTPPSSLQGVWTAHDKSPWGSGFWHNINIQMNYWLAFSANIAETFKAYVDFNKAYMASAKENAKEWISYTNPENYSEDCGWIIATGAFCYEVEGFSPYTHSGPGTGALTTKLFFDYYDFTRDENILKNDVYSVVHGMSKFLTKCVRKYEDGRYLCSFSASPEQILSGWWVDEHKYQQYIQTVGCSFDQQMIYENAKDDLECSSVLGVSDDIIEKEREQLELYDPVRIGYDGQIKEYDEERFYGEYGEAKHRHLSQLVALMPGRTITRNTPRWLDSAKITLEKRGDKSTGWALAHRLCSWARVGDGDHAYLLLQELLKNKTHPNLWDVHPPFQIDGNFGAVAGMTEMIVQSHDGAITLLPTLPERWKDLRVKGLKARGNFTIDISCKNGVIEFADIKSCVGGKAYIRCEEFFNVEVRSDGRRIAYSANEDTIVFDTEIGKSFRITGFKRAERLPTVCNLNAAWEKDGVALSWEENGLKYAVYRGKDNEKDYRLIGVTSEGRFIDKEYNENAKALLTYKVVAYRGGKHSSRMQGAIAVVNPATELEKERYKLKFRMNNINLE